MTGNSGIEGVRFDGRRVLVTGAASGIGQCSAVLFAELGAHVVMTDVSAMDETAAQITAAGGTCDSIRGDLTAPAFVTELLAHGPYFALAQIAGVYAPRRVMAEDEAFRFVMDINVRAPLNLANAVLDQMADNGGGRIVMIGSVAGRHGGSSIAGGIEYDHYAASKGALHTIVKRMSRRAVLKGVMVNAIAPGVVQTPLYDSFQSKPTGLPMDRPARPIELAWPIAFLCSPAASYISGVTLDVNGGVFVPA